MKVFHKSMWGVVLFFSLSTLSVSARLDRVDIETVTARLLRTLEMRFCFISFVRTSGQDYFN